MLTNNLSLEVAYLGNHGVKLLGLQDLNAPPLGGGPLPYAQFPYLSYINYMSNMYRSDYNAMDSRLSSVARPTGVCNHSDKLAGCAERRDLIDVWMRKNCESLGQ
jgi:hypothetical protein